MTQEFQTRLAEVSNEMKSVKESLCSLITDMVKEITNGNEKEINFDPEIETTFGEKVELCFIDDDGDCIIGTDWDNMYPESFDIDFLKELADSLSLGLYDLK